MKKLLIALLICLPLQAQRFVKQAADINTLITVINPVDINTNVWVSYRTTAGDGGGGNFYPVKWILPPTTNMGTVFLSTVNTNYYWQRNIDGNVLNVRWFGATAGAVDNTAAVQNAYNTLVGSFGGTAGGVLYFPASGSSYLLNLTISKPNVRIVGDSASQATSGGTRLSPYDITKPVIQLGNDTERAYGFTAANLTIDAQRSGTDGTAGVWLVGGAYASRWEMCTFLNGTNGIVFQGWTNYPCTKNKFIGCTALSGAHAGGAVLKSLAALNAASWTTDNQYVYGNLNGNATNYKLWCDGTSFDISGTYGDGYVSHMLYLTNSAAPIYVTDAAIDPTGTGTLTNATLIVGNSYTITTFVAGDNFTNVGASANTQGVYFLATGTTPTTWSNGSVLTIAPVIVTTSETNKRLEHYFNGQPRVLSGNLWLGDNSMQAFSTIRLAAGDDSHLGTVYSGTHYFPGTVTNVYDPLKNGYIAALSSSGVGLQVVTPSGSAQGLVINPDKNGVKISPPTGATENYAQLSLVPVDGGSFSKVALYDSTNTAASGYVVLGAHSSTTTPTLDLGSSGGATVPDLSISHPSYWWLLGHEADGKMGFNLPKNLNINPRTTFDFWGGNPQMTLNLESSAKFSFTLTNGTERGYLSFSESSGAMILSSVRAGNSSYTLALRTGDTDRLTIGNDGSIRLPFTYTPKATLTPQTIDKPSGWITIGAGTNSYTVTCALCTTNSIVYAMPAANDATGHINAVVPTTGSFTIYTVAPSADMQVMFHLFNE